MFGVWKNAKTVVTPEGINYRVYAPNALNVAVIVNNTKSISMKKDQDGIWSCVDDNGSQTDTYNFLINSTVKIDPLASYNKLTKSSLHSSVHFKSIHEWTDQKWMVSRENKTWDTEPLLILEVHIASWGDGVTYRQLSEELVDYVIDMGYNAVQFMPIQEHFMESSWGYLAASWFAPASKYGTPDDLKFLINKLHENGIAVICDLLVFHFPKDKPALDTFDGTKLFEYETTLPNFAHDVWGSNVVGFNKPHVRDFILSSLNYWLEEFHFDGVRVDALTDIIDMSLGIPKGENYYPGEGKEDEVTLVSLVKEESGGIQLVRDMNNLVKKKYPGVLMIGEEGAGFRGTTYSEKDDPELWLGFDFKYAMGTTWTMLPNYFLKAEDERDSNLLYEAIAMDQNQKRVYQLSHDDTTHVAKGSIYRSLKLKNENLRSDFYKTFLMFFICLPGKKVLFMGMDWGHHNGWNGGNHAEHGTLFSERPTEYFYRDEIQELESQREIHNFSKNLIKAYASNSDFYETDLIGLPTYEAEHMAWVLNHSDNVIVIKRGDTTCVFNFSEEDKDVSVDFASIILKSTERELKRKAGTITVPALSGVYLST